MRSTPFAWNRWFGLLAALVGCAGGASLAARSPGEPSGEADDAPCPSLPTRTSAAFRFSPGLKGPGVYEVALEVDGKKESCTITLGAPNPAVDHGGAVSMGRQEEATTCTLMTLGGTCSDGSLAALEREGESRSLHLTITQGGAPVVQGGFEPDFTPDRCGQRNSSTLLERSP